MSPSISEPGHALRSPATVRRHDGQPPPVVLLADDDQLVRSLAARILERAGFDVLTAGDGREATRLAAEHPEIALLVSDVTMPHRSGPEVARAVRQRCPEVPVILMSGYADNLREVVAAADAFLAKPFRPDDLLAVARRLLGDGAGRRDGVTLRREPVPPRTAVQRPAAGT